jgi:hypothetical protein
MVEQIGLLTSEIVSLCMTRRPDDPLELSSERLREAEKLEAKFRRTSANARSNVTPGSPQLAELLADESSAYEVLSTLHEGERRKKLATEANQAFNASLGIRIRSLGNQLGEAAEGDRKEDNTRDDQK